MLLQLTLAVCVLGSSTVIFAQEPAATASLPDAVDVCSPQYFEQSEASFAKRVFRSATLFRAEHQLKNITQRCADVPWHAKATAHLKVVQEELAGSSLAIALFYLKRFREGKSTSLKGSLSRLMMIVERYPKFSQMEQVLALLGELSLLTGDPEEGAFFYKRVIEEFPHSSYVGEAIKQVNAIEAMKVNVQRQTRALNLKLNEPEEDTKLKGPTSSRMSSFSRSTFALACVLLATANAISAQDWLQWRGPGRDGLVPAASAPKAWPESLKKVWRVETGEGYASPLVSRGRVFVHSRQDPEEIVTAIDYAKGEVLWQKKYPAPFTKNQYAVKMAKGPNATPLVAGNRLFTLGTTGILTAWDTATGKQLWTKDFSKTVDTSKMFCGTAASPLLLDGLVVVQVGSDIHGGQILALDPASGASRWEWRGLGPGYASPSVINVAGETHLVTMTNGSIVGLNTKTGTELWSVPFPDEWHENIVTPTWTGSHLIVSGPRQGTHAFSLQQVNGKWQATEAWKNSDVAMYMSSPVFGDGLIYGLSEKRKGQFVALDAKTGVVRWMTEGKEGEHASVMLTPKNLVYLTNSADLIVARRGTAKFEVEKKYNVADGATWANPVFMGTDLLVRDASGLIRLTGDK